MGCCNHGDRVLEPAGGRAAIVNGRSWNLMAVMLQSRRPRGEGGKLAVRWGRSGEATGARRSQRATASEDSEADGRADDVAEASGGRRMGGKGMR